MRSQGVTTTPVSVPQGIHETKNVNSFFEFISAPFQWIGQLFSQRPAPLSTRAVPPPLARGIGLSPDAPQIYQKYLTYYGTLTGYLNGINQKYPAGTAPANVKQDLAAITQDLTQLGTIYQADYNNDSKTLQDFENDCVSLLSSAESSYNDAMGGGGSIHDKIEADYTKAQGIASTVETAISSSTKAIEGSDINKYDSLLQELWVNITSLPPGEAKETIVAEYLVAKEKMETLLSTLLDTVTEDDKANEMASKLAEPLTTLQALSGIENPTQENLTQANTILANNFTPAASRAAALTAQVQKLTKAKSNLLQAIQKVQNALNPKPVSKVEHGCWYIDWTSWFSGTFKMPEGITTINIFVGSLTADNGGIGGFGNLSNDQIPAFVTAAKNAGVQKVKISLGGGGGSYDNTWDAVTEDNYEAIAKDLVDFCAKYNLDGVDFDYEEFKAEQEPIIGKLIASFKAQNPSLEATLCCNAGFSTWQSEVQAILDQTKDSSGKSCLDRLYVMSYYDSLQEEEGWLKQWAEWIQKEYQMEPSQLGVGVDDYDAHAYDPTQLKEWADSKGYSWCHWAYDPAKSTQTKVVEAASNFPTPSAPPASPKTEMPSSARIGSPFYDLGNGVVLEQV